MQVGGARGLERCEEGRAEALVINGGVRERCQHPPALINAGILTGLLQRLQRGFMVGRDSFLERHGAARGGGLRATAPLASSFLRKKKVATLPRPLELRPLPQLSVHPRLGARFRQRQLNTMPFEGDAPMLKGMMMLTVAGAGCYGFIHVAAPNLFQLVPVKASCAPTSTLCDKDALAAP